MARLRTTSFALAAAAAAAAACAPDRVAAPEFDVAPTIVEEPGRVQVCKIAPVGTFAVFEVVSLGAGGTLPLGSPVRFDITPADAVADGYPVVCKVVWRATSPGDAGSVRVREIDMTRGLTVTNMYFVDFSQEPAGYVEVDASTATIVVPVAYDLDGEILIKNDGEPENGNGQGCTPGYWRNHLGAWAPTGYSPGQTVGSVFANASPYAANTLNQAIRFGGGPGVSGAKMILLRAAVASLLNAAHPDVAFGSSVGDVIAAVNAALGSNDRPTMLALASELDTANNQGCPLD
jgi:hypothetical protein